MEGTEFAGHLIEEEIGRGGMGIVYRARHLALDRIRALKGGTAASPGAAALVGVVDGAPAGSR